MKPQRNSVSKGIKVISDVNSNNLCMLWGGWIHREGATNVALILTSNYITVGVKRPPQSLVPLPVETVSFLFDSTLQVITVLTRHFYFSISSALSVKYLPVETRDEFCSTMSLITS